MLLILLYTVYQLPSLVLELHSTTFSLLALVHTIQRTKLDNPQTPTVLTLLFTYAMMQVNDQYECPIRLK
jgi:hypothetical protein